MKEWTKEKLSSWLVIVLVLGVSVLCIAAATQALVEEMRRMMLERHVKLGLIAEPGETLPIRTNLIPFVPPPKWQLWTWDEDVETNGFRYFKWVEFVSSTNLNTPLAQWQRKVWRPVGTNNTQRIDYINQQEYVVMRFAYVTRPYGTNQTNYGPWNIRK